MPETEEEIRLAVELKQMKSEVFRLLPLLVNDPNSIDIISDLVTCGMRIAEIEARQPVIYLERKANVADEQLMKEQQDQAAKKRRDRAVAHKQVKRDFYVNAHPAKYIETAVQKEVNRQLRSNGGIIRSESGDGK